MPKTKPSEPDQRAACVSVDPGWRWALPLAGACVLSYAAQGGLGLLVQLYLKGLSAPTLVISLVESLAALGVLLGSLLLGPLARVRARKPLLSLALVLTAAAVGTLAFLLPPAGVLASVFARVFFLTGFAALSMALVSSASAARQRGRNLSYVTSSRSLGYTLGSLAVGFVLEAIGFRWSFLALATFPLLALFALAALPHDPGPATAPRGSTWSWLQQSGLGDLYLGTVLRQAATSGFFSLLYVYMATLGISAGAMGVVSALNAGIQVPALILFGRLADRVGRQRIVLLGFTLSTAAPCLFALSRSAWGMAAGYLLSGIGFSALYIGSTAEIGDCVPAGTHGAMLGLYESTRGLGAVLGPLVAGAVAPVIGYRGMFVTMAGIAAVGLLFVILRQRRLRNAEAS